MKNSGAETSYLPTISLFFFSKHRVRPHLPTSSTVGMLWPIKHAMHLSIAFWLCAENLADSSEN